MDTENARAQDEELLMWRMTRAMRVDLVTPLWNGRLPVAELQQMLRQCETDCPEPGACARLLADRDATAREPPAYCPNRARLMALKAG